MRLLHVTHQYWPAVGGAERYITDLSEELAERGHSVDVYTSRSLDYHSWRSELPRFERVAGVNVRRFSSLQRTQRAWHALDYGLPHHWQSGARRYEPYIFYGNGPLCPAMFAAILQAAGRYDLIHISHLHYSHALTAYAAARLRRLPVVVTPHVHIEQRATHDVRYMWKILQGSMAVLADTSAEKQYLLKCGLQSDVTVGGVGLRLERFPPLDRRESRARFGLPEDGFVVLFLGRKTEYKGLDACLSGFSSVRERLGAHLLAVGPETDYSRPLWSRWQGMDGLVVRGAVSEEERLAALAACDVLAMPSTGEAFGIVYLEAWAYRKPVIAANVAAVASLVTHGVDGLLVEPNQPADVASCLLAIGENPAVARSMGERGRARLEQRYTVSRIADIVEGTYVRALRHDRTLS